MKNLGFCLCSGILILFSAIAQADEGFPGRPKYPDVNIIELEELYKRRQKVAIVDVRSEYEYETLRIKGAINIPVASPGFSKDVRNIRGVTNKDVVFYCNGHTCMKSYKAARKAKLAKIDRVFAFDAGIFDWAGKYPEEAVLLGEPLRDTSRLISKKDFKARLLSPREFAARVNSRHGKDRYLVLDVRDRFQRAAVGLFPFQEKWAPLDQKFKLGEYIDHARKNGKTLLIYDEVGKQVRWLQYRLEKAGLRKYYFMKGGANAYIKQL